MTNVYEQKPEVVGTGESARVKGGKYDGWLADCVPESYWAEQNAIAAAEAAAAVAAADVKAEETIDTTSLSAPVTLDSAVEGQAPSADPVPEVDSVNE